MMIHTYWDSLISRWLPWLQPKEETKTEKRSSPYSSFTGSKKAVERYLGPTLHSLLDEAFTQNPRRCQRCNSGNIEPVRRKAADTKAVLEAALELHRQGDTYIVNMEQLEQHISSLYREQIAASPILCKECLQRRQVAMQRESYRFPDLSVYKTPELKLGPNLTPTGRTEKSIRKSSGEAFKKLRVSASEFRTWKKMKIGELVQATLPRLLQQDILSASNVMELQDPMRSKTIFDVNFPVLLKVNNSPDIGKDKHGYSRYYRRTVKWRNSEFKLTSQWYKNSLEPYLKWLRNFIEVEDI